MGERGKSRRDIELAGNEWKTENKERVKKKKKQQKGKKKERKKRTIGQR